MAEPQNRWCLTVSYGNGFSEQSCLSLFVNTAFGKLPPSPLLYVPVLTHHDRDVGSDVSFGKSWPVKPAPGAGAMFHLSTEQMTTFSILPVWIEHTLHITLHNGIYQFIRWCLKVKHHQVLMFIHRRRAPFYCYALLVNRINLNNCHHLSTVAVD